MSSKREPPAAVAPEHKPVLRLRYKERTPRLACPAPYDGEWVEVWINTPEAYLATDDSTGDILVKVIRAWSFETVEGQPAPVTLEALLALPSELIRWLWEEYVALRTDPLGLPHSTPKRNGTPPTATLAGAALSASSTA